MMHTLKKANLERALGWLLAIAFLSSVNPALGQTAAPNQASRAPRTVLVSIPDRKLAVLENGTVIAGFAVSVGAAGSPSPTGEFTIVNRVAQPSYYHKGIVIPPGKANPVGTRWVGLSQKGYGIHGTNAPQSIGHAASHGCIRLRNRDIEKLFSLLREGDVVRIRGQRDAQTAEIFGAPASSQGTNEPANGATSAEANRAAQAIAVVAAETEAAGTVSSF